MNYLSSKIKRSSSSRFRDIQRLSSAGTKKCTLPSKHDNVTFDITAQIHSKIQRLPNLALRGVVLLTYLQFLTPFQRIAAFSNFKVDG